MADYLVRSLGDKTNIIGLACVTTGLVYEISQLHGTSRTASAALGRALTGGLLMGALMKRRQRIALKFEGNGPLKKIIVEADNEGTVRGFVAVPEADVPNKDGKLDVSGLLGNEGTLTVAKDLGLKEPYRGMVDRIIKNIKEIPFVTQMIREGKTPEEMLARIFSDIPYHILGNQELSFRCTCGKKRGERALL